MSNTGLGASLSAAAESTYGTYVPATRTMPFETEDGELDVQRFKSNALVGPTVLGQVGRLVRKTTRQAAIPFNRPVITKGEGLFLGQGHGETVTVATPGGATLARTQTHSFGISDPKGKSMSLQVIRPDVSGTSNPHTFIGGKTTGFSWSLEAGGGLMLQTDIDARDMVSTETAAALVVPSNYQPWVWDQFSIEFDDVVYTDCVTGLSIEYAIPSKTDRWCIGGGALKKEPLQNEKVLPTITLEMEFASNAQWLAFRNDTRRKLEILGVGDQIEVGHNYEYGFTFAETATIAASPKVEGPDVITQTVQFEAYSNGSAAPMVINTKGVDTTL